jgi:hypothetical protein
MTGCKIMEFVGIGLAIRKPCFSGIGDMIHFAPLLCEKMWSKVKQVLRSLEPRTHEELLDAIATALSRVIPKPLSN